MPKIAAYALSFLVVGELWYVHHTRFTYINRCDARLIWLNMLFLMTIGFVPFASSVLSEHPNATAYALYDGTMALAAVLSAALWGYAIAGDRLVPAGLDPEIRRRSMVAPLRVAAVFVLSGVLAQVEVRAARWGLLLLIPAAVEWHGRRRGRHHAATRTLRLPNRCSCRLLARLPVFRSMKTAAAGAGFPVARDTMQRYKWKLCPMQRSGER